MSSKKLIVILGPTAVGKTNLSIQLAKLFNSDILSADSRQFYKQLDIGTAKPTLEEMQGVRHHFISNKSLDEEYNSSKFEMEALQLLENKFVAADRVIMVGGSGLYIKAVCSGFDAEMPTASLEVRSELQTIYENDGLKGLQNILRELDQDFYNQVDIQNKVRMMRAIEVCKLTGKKYSELRKGKTNKRAFDCIKIGLELPREELYERINLRVDKMLEEGLEKEAQSVKSYRNQNALKTVGYKEFFEYFDGKISREEAIEKIKTNSRRYAKRQMTWFKKDEEITWFQPSDLDKIVTFIYSIHTDGK